MWIRNICRVCATETRPSPTTNSKNISFFFPFNFFAGCSADNTTGYYCSKTCAQTTIANLDIHFFRFTIRANDVWCTKDEFHVMWIDCRVLRRFFFYFFYYNLTWKHKEINQHLTWNNSLVLVHCCIGYSMEMNRETSLSYCTIWMKIIQFASTGPFEPCHCWNIYTCSLWAEKSFESAKKTIYWQFIQN